MNYWIHCSSDMKKILERKVFRQFEKAPRETPRNTLRDSAKLRKIFRMSLRSPKRTPRSSKWGSGKFLDRLCEVFREIPRSPEKHREAPGSLKRSFVKFLRNSEKSSERPRIDLNFKKSLGRHREIPSELREVPSETSGSF